VWGTPARSAAIGSSQAGLNIHCEHLEPLAGRRDHEGETSRHTIGLAVLLHAFARFVREGLGTPAPVTPTERLVVGGLYGYVRNPMYLAVAAIIVGQALTLGQLVLFPYAGAFALAFAAFVRFYEEPTLRRQLGEQYESYRRAVPPWWPRRKPWQAPNVDP
jgi:protein-S-isoprenylcysteine O-methyltransferase Ste14